MPLNTPLDSIGVRAFRPEDAGSLFSATRETIDLLCAWMTWCKPDYLIQDARAFVAQAMDDWKNDLSYSFAVVDLVKNEVLGSVGISQVSRRHQTANLGYWMRSSRSGLGITSEAVKMVAQFGLGGFNLRRLEIVIPEGNMASQGVAVNCGAKFEGLLRDKLILNGQSHAALMYSLVAADVD